MHGGVESIGVVRATRAAAVAAALLLPAPLAAHDFWLEPSSFLPEPGSAVLVRFMEGDDFRGSPLPRNERRLVAFVLSGPGGASDVPGADGADPAGIARPAGPGLHVVSYRNTPAALTLDGPRFEAHLRREGLERIAALRAARGQSGSPARERFFRCAKALLAVGGAGGVEDGGGGGHERAAGLELELTPEADPYGLAVGGTLPVRLAFRGAPLAGALVTAIPRAAPGEAAGLRTDAAGRVRIPLAHSGPWLVKAVHMEAAAPGTGADWESWWASLTFAAPGD